MNKQLEAYRKAEDRLLFNILDRRFFSIWKNPTALPDLHRITDIELIVTPECNQSCEYCYLYKYGNRLNPTYTRDKDTILTNLRILLDYFSENEFSVETLNLFSGDIWHLDFGREILGIVLSYLQKEKFIVKCVLIPSNCSFIDDDNSALELHKIIDEYKSTTKSRLVFSCSVDGLPVENISRPRNDGFNRTQEWYDKLFTFATKNDYAFHPMVAASNIHLWVENFDWFRTMSEKYKMSFPNNVMMLEVRNTDWDDTSLSHLKKLYRHVIDYYLEVCDGDLEFMAMALLDMDTKPDPEMVRVYRRKIYGNVAISSSTNNIISCTVSTDLAIRLGDLMIVPCHRLSYDHLNYGQFTVTDGSITGVIANNNPMAMKILFGNTNTTFHGCDTCVYRTMCIKGCIGEQFETTKDPFFVDQDVCKLLKFKYDSILGIYDEIGLIDWLKDIKPTDRLYLQANDIIVVVDAIMKGRC